MSGTMRSRTVCYYIPELCFSPTIWFNNYRRVAYIRTPAVDSLGRSSSNGRRRTVPVGNRRTRSASSGNRRCNLHSPSVAGAGAQNVPEFSKRAKQACGATRTAFLPPLTRSVLANVRLGRRHYRTMFTGPVHRATAASIQSRPSRYPPARQRRETPGRRRRAGADPRTRQAQSGPVAPAKQSPRH